MANFSYLTREEMDHLIDWVFSKQQDRNKRSIRSLESAKALTIVEVTGNLDEIIRKYRTYRERYSRVLHNYRSNLIDEEFRLRMLEIEFNSFKMMISTLPAALIAAFGVIKLMGSVGKKTVEFAIRNQKLVPKNLPFWPKVSNFEAKLSTKSIIHGMMKGTVQMAREDPIEVCLFALNFISNCSEPAFWAKLVAGDPSSEIKKYLEDLGSNKQQIEENATQTIKEYDSIIENLFKKKQDIIQFIKGIR